MEIALHKLFPHLLVKMIGCAMEYRTPGNTIVYQFGWQLGTVIISYIDQKIVCA